MLGDERTSIGVHDWDQVRLELIDVTSGYHVSIGSLNCPLGRDDERESDQGFNFSAIENLGAPSSQLFGEAVILIGE